MKVILSNGYVLMNEEGYLIGLDDASGGYPHQTVVFGSAKVWTRKGDAVQYRATMNEVDNWTIHQLKLGEAE